MGDEPSNQALAGALVFQDPNIGAAPDETTSLFAEDQEPKAPEPFFALDTKDTVPVIQRAAEDHIDGALYFGSQTGSFQIGGRRKGRRHFTLWCPSAWTTPAGATVTPLGFQFGDVRSKVDNNAGAQINPGDSITIESEGAIWIAVLPGQSYGIVQYMEVFDTSGGPVQ